MSTIPEPEVTLQDLILWYEAKQQLALVKNREMLLRKRIYEKYFPNAKEGTNKSELDDGWLLKAQRVVDRKIDMGMMDSMLKDGQLRDAGINPVTLVEYKPELVVREYRKLTDEQRHIFDQCLIIKDGSPQMDIVLPASVKKNDAQG